MIEPSSLDRSSTTAGPGSITVQPFMRCKSDSASSRLRSSTSCFGASSGNRSLPYPANGPTESQYSRRAARLAEKRKEEAIPAHDIDSSTGNNMYGGGSGA
ncbi:hypothetical protein SAMN05444171_1269 [Bradyrhizobium lablabi]|uniref:Uncharacterized protein n=2 Tax=Bradyrhizobium TaxID=374 RepID=A0ABY0Q715_9BRAD|nr:hypothetical protein SAMN05444163_5887 [Bradyrhizobium ottawaense]SEC37968.1 hypothetical protein SAMN05444171_1269 [Bradyrhizobium lablabi]